MFRNSGPKEFGIMAGGFGWLLIVIMGLILVPMWGCPHYHVYNQEMMGIAKLKESESSKQILMQDAKARREAAKDLAQAEIERAKGVAEANRIIGEGLKDNEAYLMYLWVQGMADNDNQIIYVPTETGMPILEAGRLNRPRPVPVPAPEPEPVLKKGKR